MARALVILILIGPVIAGLIGVILPAFGYFPAAGADQFSLEPIQALFAWNGIGPAVRLSVTTGLLATALSCLIALGFTASMMASPWWRRVQSFLGPLLAVPHAAAAFGLVFLIAPSGWLARVLAPFLRWDRPPDLLIVNDPLGLALVLGLVIKEVPFLLLMIIAALPQVDAPSRLKASASLGYGPIAGWTFALLPAVYNQIRLPIYLVLAFSMSVVDVALILGPTTPNTLAVQVLKWMNDPDITLRGQAAAGALLQLLLIGAMIGVFRMLERTLGALGRWLIAGGWRLSGLERLKPIFTGFSAVVFSTLIVGFCGLLMWSIAGFWTFPDIVPDSLSLSNWVRHSNGLTDRLSETAIIGVTVAGVSLMLAILYLESTRTLPSWAIFLPLIIPQVAFLPGVQILLLNLGLRGGLAVVIAAHLVFVLPYVILTLGGSYRAWNRDYAHAAHALGATPSRVFWRLRLPMLIGPLLTALAVGLAVSVGQYLPTLLVGGGRVSTLTTEAVALASGGDRRAIAVFSVLQLMAALVPFVIALVLPMILWRNRRGMSHG